MTKRPPIFRIQEKEPPPLLYYITRFDFLVLFASNFFRTATKMKVNITLPMQAVFACGTELISQ